MMGDMLYSLKYIEMASSKNKQFQKAAKPQTHFDSDTFKSNRLSNFRSDKEESSALQKQRQHHKISAIGPRLPRSTKINGVDIQMIQRVAGHVIFLSIHQQWEHDRGPQTLQN